MALKPDQVQLSLNTLYKLEILNQAYIKNSISPHVWINSGSVDIYGSNSATQPASLAAMTLNIKDTAREGIEEIIAMPVYIAIKQNVGTTTEIVLDGFKVTDLGAIS